LRGGIIEPSLKVLANKYNVSARPVEWGVEVEVVGRWTGGLMGWLFGWLHSVTSRSVEFVTPVSLLVLPTA